ncbi:MAG: pyridoxamine 5'-phosphate oxidase [Gammaproteobacteria bacterium]|nr:pyridoxamine 5'-phosphate oxidase [Gammaproteobacteria bacterium]
MKDLQQHRREYGKRELREKSISPDPFVQFEAWLTEALESDILDPTAMVLATVDHQDMPDTRIVLLKQFDHHGLVFYTHYESPKAKQAENTGKVALNFYWSSLAKQIRIRGTIERIAREDSAAYFASRSRESQICAVASQQSTSVANREELERRVKATTAHYADQAVTCPANWGGYRVIPLEFEFFQGRDNRLHDRIHYLKVNQQWEMSRLAP